MLGCPEEGVDSDIYLIDSAFKLLTSGGEAIKDLAVQELRQIVRWRVRRIPREYLSQNTESESRTGTDAEKTVWSLAIYVGRWSCRGFGIGRGTSMPSG
jgi:hypothetical protein